MSEAAILPHDEEAERAVIGAILLRGSAFSDVSDIVSSSDFYHPANEAIYASFEALSAASVPIDVLTLSAKMKDNATWARLKGVGYEAYLARVMDSVVTAENAAFYAKIVASKSHRRRLTVATADVAQRGYSTQYDDQDFLDDADRDLFDALQRRSQSKHQDMRTIIKSLLPVIERRYERKEAVTGVPTGLQRLDEITTGLQPSDLVIVAARPSMGKTSLAVQIAANAAMKHVVPSIIFSLEMSKESLMERILCSESKIDSMRMRTGKLEKIDWVNLVRVAGEVGSAPVWIDDEAGVSISDIRAKARRWRSDPRIFPKVGTPGMVLVDYLQLVTGSARGREQNREREIAEISSGLKSLAKELRCPVVALSQLNRGLESRADKRPMLSDLRDSGSIEQDADLVVFIYRDEVYNDDSEDKGIAELIVGKQRNGAVGTVRVAFMPQYTRFENLSRRQEEESPRASSKYGRGNVRAVGGDD